MANRRHCIVNRDKVTIFLDAARTAHPVPLNQYWAVYIYVADADAMLAELTGRGVAIEDQPYGCRDFDLRDPDGHLIGIGHELSRKPG